MRNSFTLVLFDWAQLNGPYASEFTITMPFPSPMYAWKEVTGDLASEYNDPHKDLR